MKKVIYIEDIVCLGLLYNYLANDENGLSYLQAIEYIYAVKKNISSVDKNHEICFTYGKQYSGMGKYDELLGQYKLNNVDNIDNWYNVLLKELVDASLKEDALAVISVEKEKLQIQKSYQVENGVKSVYSTSAARAQNDVVAILESLGYENIKIGSAIFKSEHGETVFDVSYSAKKAVKKLVFTDKKD